MQQTALGLRLGIYVYQGLLSQESNSRQTSAEVEAKHHWPSIVQTMLDHLEKTKLKNVQQLL